jgi:hypothetical protein
VSTQEIEFCGFLGYYTASCGNYLPTFRDNVSVPSSRVKIPNSKKFLFKLWACEFQKESVAFQTSLWEWVSLFEGRRRALVFSHQPPLYIYLLLLWMPLVEGGHTFSWCRQYLYSTLQRLEAGQTSPQVCQANRDGLGVSWGAIVEVAGRRVWFSAKPTGLLDVYPWTVLVCLEYLYNGRKLLRRTVSRL